MLSAKSFKKFVVPASIRLCPTRVFHENQSINGNYNSLLIAQTCEFNKSKSWYAFAKNSLIDGEI